MALYRTLNKTAICVGIQILVALAHFMTGRHYTGPYPNFVNGYLLDILVPFAFYFLLLIHEFPLLRHWAIKSILVFGAGATVEIAQFHGARIFGATFDPLDFVMYAIGVISAAVLDTLIFPRIFAFWSFKAGKPIREPFPEHGDDRRG